MDKLEYKEQNKMLRKEIGTLQQKIKEAGIPVLILLEGWECSGKGTLINELIREMDPRSFLVKVYDEPSDAEKRRPFLWRFWQGIPKKGNINIFDRSHYLQLMRNKNLGKKIKDKDIKDIQLFEKQLVDGGTRLIKIFLQISEDTQKKRAKELLSDPWTAFRVSKRDRQQIKNRKKYEKLFEEMLQKTNFTFGQWHILSGEDRLASIHEMLTLVRNQLQEFLAQQNYQKSFTLLPTMPEDAKGVLQYVDLTKALTKEEYEEQLDKLQKQAQELAYGLYVRKIPTLMVFEGWDAAGKGSSIKRLTQPVDPRGFEVVPTAAPDETEKQYNYMWRFYKNLPKTGHMAIFDRSWYGRLMVERVEGFATEEEIKRSYGEINGNEHHFSNWGALIIKFFIHIDKNEQIKRFQEREAEADKNYKITPEDWRNRDKWEEYTVAIEEMLYRTSTHYAPWYVVPGNDKYYARIKVLETFVRHAQERLAQEDKKKKDSKARKK